MARRKTVNRDTIVTVANEMIAHLAQSGTREDQVKREAISAVVSSILLRGAPNDAYCGFRYLHPPLVYVDAATNKEVVSYDDSRIAFL